MNPVINAESLQARMVLAYTNPKESLRQIRAVTKDIRQMLRNNADQSEISSALNKILILTGEFP